jgi:hypothetical protein
MNKLLTALILVATALTAQATEKQTLKMEFGECVMQSRDLAKKGTNVKEVDLVKSAGIMMTFFETSTHHISITCGIISRGNDIMNFTKQTLVEYRASNAQAEANRQAKTQDLSKQLGL